MKLRPLTEKEQKFAEVNHELIYSFLSERNLNKDDYYDIVIFGYLRAVQEYCENPELYRYKFSTLAWKHMRNAYTDYCKYNFCKKRNTSTISIDEAILVAPDIYVEHAVSYDEYVTGIKTELLLHELARRLPEREMRIVRMKVRGDKLQDIARAERLNFQQIGRMLDDIYPTVIKIIYE